MNFNPPREFVWFVRFDEIPSFFPFVRGSNLFRFIRFNWSTKKESEKLKNSHFGQIHVQPDFNTFSYSASVMNEHSLWIHISQPSHWTALWTLRTAPLHRPQSALQFVQYQSLLPVSIFNMMVWVVKYEVNQLNSFSQFPKGSVTGYCIILHCCTWSQSYEDCLRVWFYRILHHNVEKKEMFTRPQKKKKKKKKCFLPTYPVFFFCCCCCFFFFG